MAMGINSQLNVSQHQKQSMKMRQFQAVKNLIDDFKQNEESEDENEAIEPPPEEAAADDYSYLYQEKNESNLDYEIKSATPPFHQLLARLRLPVQFYINPEFKIKDLMLGGREAPLVRRKIVRAIISHLQKNNCVLKDPGDWIHIPAIKTDDNLIGLVEENTADQKQLKGRLKSYGSFYKSFAILLPNFDLVTPQALIDVANRKGKSLTTLAAGLKIVHDLHPLEFSEWKPVTIAGEDWSNADLVKFYKRHKSKAK